MNAVTRIGKTNEGKTSITTPNTESGATPLFSAVRRTVLIFVGTLLIAFILGLIFSFIQPVSMTIPVVVVAIGSVIGLAFLVFEVLRGRSQPGGLISRESLGGAIFRGWISAVFVLGVLALSLSIAVLCLLEMPYETYLTAIEVGILVLTLTTIVLLARYSARSFSADVATLIVDNRASSEALRGAFATSAQDLGRSFDRNTERLIQQAEAQSQRSLAILQDLTGVVKNLADAIREERHEARKVAEETVRLQREMEERRHMDEEARQEERRIREEEERQRLMPVIGLEMHGEGILFHNVHLRVTNAGMDARNIQAVVRYRGRQLSLRAGTLASQGILDWDLGDVSRFMNREAFEIECTVADIQGRQYLFHIQFHYTRTTGFLGRTTGMHFNPSGFQYPPAQPLIG